MIEQIVRNLASLKLRSCGIAVSGGSDSIALFHIMTDWESENKPQILVASVDHGLRSESRSEVEFVKKNVKTIWRVFGIGNEFTIEDKIIYLVSYVWNILFTLVFILGTIYNLSNDVIDETWMVYWKYQVYINIVFSFIIIIWFTVGGFIDIKKMFSSLGSSERDHNDSGWVEN